MMKTCFFIFLMLAVFAVQADTIVSQTFSPDLMIPEGNPAGVVSAGNFTAGSIGDLISGITVDLDISGGYNGDLYMYLVAPNGTLITLMNQPGTAVNGFGAESSGMNLTLDDDAATSIQNVTGGAGTVLTGTFHAKDTMGTFNNSPADGTWNLFIADLGNGTGSPVLDSWTLHVLAVPEPSNMALGIFLSVFVIKAKWRRK